MNQHGGKAIQCAIQCDQKKRGSFYFSLIRHSFTADFSLFLSILDYSNISPGQSLCVNLSVHPLSVPLICQGHREAEVNPS